MPSWSSPFSGGPPTRRSAPNRSLAPSRRSRAEGQSPFAARPGRRRPDRRRRRPAATSPAPSTLRRSRSRDRYQHPANPASFRARTRAVPPVAVGGLLSAHRSSVDNSPPIQNRGLIFAPRTTLVSLDLRQDFTERTSGSRFANANPVSLNQSTRWLCLPAPWRFIAPVMAISVKNSFCHDDSYIISGNSGAHARLVHFIPM